MCTDTGLQLIVPIPSTPGSDRHLGRVRMTWDKEAKDLASSDAWDSRLVENTTGTCSSRFWQQEVRSRIFLCAADDNDI